MLLHFQRDSYANVNIIVARLMPESMLVDNWDDVVVFLLQGDIAPFLGFINYFWGVSINKIGDEDTAVHPAIRNSACSLFKIDANTNKQVQTFLPNDLTVVCYNHHSRV